MASSEDEGTTTTVTKKKRYVKRPREATEVPKHWAPTKDRKDRRKTTRHFQFEDKEEPEPRKKGPGLKLKKIDVIRENFDEFAKKDHKTWVDDLREVHLILYGKTAKKTMLRRNILNYDGFNAKNEHETERLISRLNNRTFAFLSWFASLLGLSTESKQKSELIEDILVPFLQKPDKKACKKRKRSEYKSKVSKTHSGKRVTAPKKNSDDYYSDTDVEDEEEEEENGKEEESKGKKEAEKASSKSKKKSAKESKSKSKKSKEKEESEEEEEEEEEKEEDDPDDDPESEEEEEVKKPPKKKAKTTPKKKKKKKATALHKDLEVGTYFVEYSPTSRAACQESSCKEKIQEDEIRIGRMVKSNFSEHPMPKYYHLKCVFKAMNRMRKGTPIVTRASDLVGFDELKPKDKAAVEKAFKKYGAEAEEEEEEEQ